MRVLVIGSGGREHAIAWALSRSPQVTQVYVAPGNAGTQWQRRLVKGLSVGAPCANVPIFIEDIHGLVAFSRLEDIALTIVGPEIPLASGIVDIFQAEGLRIFGADRYAAQLESSKAFAKQFMVTHNIPTAPYAAFTQMNDAFAYARAHEPQIVVKADGLCAGKGVFVCSTHEQSERAIEAILRERIFGQHGDTLLLEDCLTGREISVLVFCDGKTIAAMPVARDHKRIFDGDLGENTGGMGAIAPAPDVDTALVDEVIARVIRPAVDGMAAVGHPYQGVLYAGIMVTETGIVTLEFNCRFGDPETQAILPLLKTDLLDVLNACVDGTLDQITLEWSEEHCATVILAAGGYPLAYARGQIISGLEAAQARTDSIVFHAGTDAHQGAIVTNGGRVLGLTSVAPTLDAALDAAYALTELIHFDEMHFRKDIGRTWTTKAEQ